MMSRSGIQEMLECANQLGLFVLLEAFDEADIEVMHRVLAPGVGPRRHAEPATGPAVAADGASATGATVSASAALIPAAPVLAGLNCRDLTTLQIVPPRLVELAPLLPKHVPRVAESGVTTPEDAARVAAVGYELALVGSALMQGGDPHTLAAAMLNAGRKSHRP
ncbi:MAG: hypothetical protein JSR66_27705 [Proteobacteria bacterium]|nr:hypothetical protein [Pseudomonadota bacterium]